MSTKARTSDADELIAALRDGRSEVREEALSGLAALHHTGPELVPFLRDADAKVALAAAEALGQLGVAQRKNLVAIANALDGARREVVTAVERMLSELVGIADADLLAIFDTAESVACNALVRACARLGVGGLQFLQRAARDERPRVRINAALGIAALGEIEPDSSIALLMELGGRDGVSDVRWAAQRSGAVLTARVKSLDAEARRRRAPAPPAVPHLDERELTAAELDAGAKVAPIEELLRALTNPRSVARINSLRMLALQGRAAAAASGAAASLLRDDESTVRIEAARALAKLQAPYVAKSLARALGDDDAAVVAAVEQALDELGSDPAVVTSLVEGLDVASESHGMRVAALISRSPDGARRLADALASTRVDARINAALGLAALGKQRAAFALPALIAATSKTNARLHAAISRAIAVISPRRTTTATKFADPDPAVRASAVLALGADSITEIISCLRDDAEEVRVAAVRALAKLGGASVTPAARTLVETFATSRGELAQQIATYLTAHTSVAIDEALVWGLDHDDFRVADRIIEIVLARPSASDVLATAFERSSSRTNASRALIRLGKPNLGRARRVLEEARASTSAAERDLARITLETIDGPPAAPSIPSITGFETELLDDKAFSDKLDAAQLLPFTYDARAIVRANTVTALGNLGKAAVPLATSIGVLLRDDDSRVRIAAARSLGRLGDDAVLATAPQLVAAMRGEATVAEACKATLATRREKVESALLAGLETDDEAHGLRIAALVSALPNARELLFAAFDGEAQNIQINAAFGIALLGPKGAGPAGRRRLVEGLAGPHNRRRSAMEKALRLMDAR